MYWLEGSAYLAGGLLFLSANLAFGASCVVYNSYLPQIAPPEERDAVSSKGWGIGYLGGGLLLALNVALYPNAGKLGLERRAGGADQPGFRGRLVGGLHAHSAGRPAARKPLLAKPPGASYLTGGFRRVAGTFAELRRYRQTLLFLVAYLLYNDPIQAVLVLAAQFGNDELKMPHLAR